MYLIERRRMKPTEVQTAVIKKYGKIIQTFVAIEEMSELMKELSKNMRGEKNHDALVEEVADVYIMLDQIMTMYKLTYEEVTEMMWEKLKRTEERLKVIKNESV